MNDPRMLRRASRESLVTFVERALAYLIFGYQHFAYVDLLAAKIEELVAPPTLGRLVVNMPPRHGKSFVLVAAAAWYLGRYPEREVILAAHSESLANDLAGKVAMLMRSPLFADVFPGFQLMEGREAMADFRTSKHGGFRAASIGSGITGRGADLLLIDDSLSAHDANSAIERQAVRDRFDGMLGTRINDPKTGAIISVSQRLHEEDLSGHLIKLGYEHLRLPFEATEDEEYSCRGILFKRRIGEVLQPGRISVDDVRKNLSPHVYATQYQQVPTAMGSGVLSARNFPLVDSCPEGGYTVVSYDPASSLGDRASHTAILVIQVFEDAAYLKHIVREKLDFSSLKARALRIHDTFKPKHHLVEMTSVGAALVDALREAHANVVEIKVGAASKIERVEAVLNKFESNYLHIVKGIPNETEFLNECSAFPHGSSDDLVDAASQFLKWIREQEANPEPPMISRGVPTGSRDKLAKYRKRKW